MISNAIEEAGSIVENLKGKYRGRTGPFFEDGLKEHRSKMRKISE